MKASKNPNEKLVQLRAAYLQMPNLGAALNVSPDGAVGNGIAIVARFKSKSSACRQLRMAGFLPTAMGWFVWEKANQINSRTQEATR